MHYHYNQVINQNQIGLKASLTNTPLDSIHYFRNNVIVSSIYCNNGFCKHLNEVKLKDKYVNYVILQRNKKCKKKLIAKNLM